MKGENLCSLKLRILKVFRQTLAEIYSVDQSISYTNTLKHSYYQVTETHNISNQFVWQLEDI